MNKLRKISHNPNTMKRIDAEHALRETELPVKEYKVKGNPGDATILRKRECLHKECGHTCNEAKDYNGIAI
jgi:hypothetical protein